MITRTEVRAVITDLLKKTEEDARRKWVTDALALNVDPDDIDDVLRVNAEDCEACRAAILQKFDTLLDARPPRTH